jgi:hypothetical protein
MTSPEAGSPPAAATKKQRKTPVREEPGFNLKYMPYIIANHCQLDPDTGKPIATKLKASVLVKIIEDKFGHPVTVGSLRASLAALEIVDSFYKPAESRKKNKESVQPEQSTELTLPGLAARVQKLEQTKTKTKAPTVGRKLRQELDEIETHLTLTLPALIQLTITSLRAQEQARRRWLLEFVNKAKAAACDVTELQAVMAKAPEDCFLELEANLSEFKQQGAAARQKRQKRLQFKDDNEADSQQEIV